MRDLCVFYLVSSRDNILQNYSTVSQPEHWRYYSQETAFWDFPGGAVVENPPANAGDTGSSPGPGRSHMQWSN